jgi:hypothetical protein
MVFSQVASNSTYFTGLALLNPGATDANVKIEVFSSAGVLLATKQEVIVARQRKSKILTEYFPALAAQEIGSGYIRINSDRGLAGFALFGTANLSVLSAVPPQIVP